MFSKLSVVCTAVLITLATAMPDGIRPEVTPPTSEQCCASVVSATNSAVLDVARVLGLDLSGLDVPIGLSCSPATAGSDCGGTKVICDTPEKEWGGLIAINCVPTS